jgi:hypothetical protein
MSKSLEDILRGLAKRGELSYLSIIPRGDEFSASYSPASNWGHGHGQDTDPVKAILDAIRFASPVRKRKPDVDPEVAELLS